MKKSILILGAIVIVSSLTAFTYLKVQNQEQATVANWSSEKHELDFYMGVGTRFSPITKEEISTKKNLHELLLSGNKTHIVKINSATLKLVDKDNRKAALSSINSEVITQDFLSAFNELELSTNFVIETHCDMDYQCNNKDLGFFTPHYTLSPKTIAKFPKGNEEFLSDIKAEIKTELSTLNNNEIRPGKVYFTVLKSGKINNVYMTGTSGSKSVDEKIMLSLKSYKEKWIPAKDSKGNVVDQELVLSVGKQGC